MIINDQWYFNSPLARFGYAIIGERKALINPRNRAIVEVILIVLWIGILIGGLYQERYVVAGFAAFCLAVRTLFLCIATQETKASNPTNG
jgi:hypothetical protein